MSISVLIKLVKEHWPLMVALFFIVLLFGMGMRIDALNSDIGQYKKDNEALSTALAGRDETITALKGSIDADRRATEEQLKIEQQKRAKADAENKTLREALEHSGCNNQRLPDDALRILRREG
ncbi:DUF2570 family protein [Serratia fonticola]|uniref:DUF2570 family protein n=1 Tax=Serratia fonticola TaxID=47917 RepID=UPI001648EDFF|nr:DUF2570 family protein [Serratia fonticola]MBC3253521.1 DUF2570 family protein [Serratia fonticola]